MATLIVEVDDNKLKMVKDVLKAMGVSVEKAPNQITIQAIKDACNCEVTKADSVNNLFKSI